VKCSICHYRCDEDVNWILTLNGIGITRTTNVHTRCLREVMGTPAVRKMTQHILDAGWRQRDFLPLVDQSSI